MNILLIINICVTLINIIVTLYWIYRWFFKKIKIDYKIKGDIK
jgi:hypothetical protein